MVRFFKQSDKEERFREIYEQYYNLVYQTAYYMTKDPHLALDVLQETFIKAYQKIHTLEDPQKIKAWLTTITTNSAVDLIKKQKIGNQIPTETVYIDIDKNDTMKTNIVEQEIELISIRDEIAKQLEKLTPEHRQVLLLKHKGLSIKEIAAALHLSVGAVKTRIYRARLILKKTLHNEFTSLGGHQNEKKEEEL